MSPYCWFVNLSERATYIAHIGTLFIKLIPRMNDRHGGIELMERDRKEVG